MRLQVYNRFLIYGKSYELNPYPVLGKLDYLSGQYISMLNSIQNNEQ